MILLGRRAARFATAGALAALLVSSPAPPAEEARPASASSPPCAHPLLERPDGPAVGCLGEGAQARVQERIPGWVRVQVEGWMAETAGASLSAPPGLAAVAGTAVSSEGAPAAGAMARLLERVDDLEAALAGLRQRHQAERAELDRRLAEVDRALERALFSSDNLTQAQENRRRLRREREALEERRRVLSQKDLEEALALLERHQARSATSDPNGFFLLEGIQPGRYALLVSSGRPGEGPTWYVPLTLSAGERQRVDLGRSDPRAHPLSGLD